MEWFEIIVSFSALTLLEIVLGIDNLVLLAVLTERLPAAERKRARYWGLTFAWILRLLMLGSAVWLTRFTRPIIEWNAWTLSCRDLFMILGGGFLLMKATQEIHQAVLHDERSLLTEVEKRHRLLFIVLQIAMMDVIFSLDSVLTAIGLTNQFWIMAIAMTAAILIMLFAFQTVSQFIAKYPTLKMLALSFLMLIGMALFAEGFSFHIPRPYIYFAMGFSLSVEMLNLLRKSKTRRRKTKP